MMNPERSSKITMGYAPLCNFLFSNKFYSLHFAQPSHQLPPEALDRRDRVLELTALAVALHAEKCEIRGGEGTPRTINVVAAKLFGSKKPAIVRLVPLSWKR